MDSAFAEYLGTQLIIMLVVALIIGAALGVGLWEGIPWLWHHVSINIY